jgi:ATPase subunit of ABC transporter with duplicated ATPase domains
MSLTVRDLTVEIGGKTIVEGVSFDIRAGEKVGLVGRNGAGKTTLFRVLGGAVAPKSGTVHETGSVGFLSQDPRADDTPADTNCLSRVLSGRDLDVAAERLAKLTVAMEEDCSDANIAAFSDAQENFERLGGYSAEAEARRIVAGIGLSESRLDLTVGALSGGERRRLELARILFAGSDLLLLDEPTNHLDADARDWLLRHLRSYKGALLVISHDLGLLDESITRILHIDREGEEAVGELVQYKGTYSQYIRTRAADEERGAAVAKRQSKEIARLKTQADSMRGQTAKRARVARNLDVRAKRLVEEQSSSQPVARQRKIDVHLPAPPPAGRTVLEATDLYKSYGSVDVLEDITFSLGRGERLLVLGLNGAGKTTLLKVLAGDTQPDLGTVYLEPRTKIGYFAQEHESITEGRTLLDQMGDHGSLTVQHARSVMGMFGLAGDKVNQDASTLSGGEKTKLSLAQLVAGAHNVLLLDEPTNNLDPSSRTAIGRALAGWGGTIILVSHDPDFVRDLQPDRVLMMPEGTLDYFSDEMLDLVTLA